MPLLQCAGRQSSSPNHACKIQQQKTHTHHAHVQTSMDDGDETTDSGEEEGTGRGAKRGQAKEKPQQIDEGAILYRGVLPPKACERLIRMSHCGEREFSRELDTVDDQPLYQIDLVQHGWISERELWPVVGPLFDRELKPLLAELPWLRGSAFTLDFVFLKRYR